MPLSGAVSKIILGIGSPMVDLLVQVPDQFVQSRLGGKGGSCLVEAAELDRILTAAGGKTERVPGGSAANTIFGLTQLGLPTAFLGKLGADEPGEFYRCRYAAMGGDTSRIRVHPQLPTGRCLGLITPDAERTMRTDLGAAATLGPEELTIADFAECRHVHLEGYLLFNELLVRRILHLAREAGCTVSLDLASFEVVRAATAILPELLRRYVDLVFANEAEAAAFPDSGETPEKALATLAGLCPLAAVKLGPHGACNTAKKLSESPPSWSPPWMPPAPATSGPPAFSPAGPPACPCRSAARSAPCWVQRSSRSSALPFPTTAGPHCGGDSANFATIPAQDDRPPSTYHQGVRRSHYFQNSSISHSLSPS